MKLEVVVIPVSDVDRAKEFYAGSGGGSTPTSTTVGIPRDPVHAAGLRVLGYLRQECHRGGARSAQGLYLIVSDIEAARDELVAHGVDASEVFHDAGGGSRCADHPYLFGGCASVVRIPTSQLPLVRLLQRSRRQRLAAAGGHDAASPGVSPATRHTRRRATCRRRCSAPRPRTGEHEAQTGQADANWPDWYAEYMVREQAGEELPK